MGDLTQKRRKIAKNVARNLLKKFSNVIEEIFLYGSVARGDDNEESDIDIECIVDTAFMPTDISEMPYQFPEYVKEVERKFNKYKVHVDLRNASEFNECLKRTRLNPAFEKGYFDKILHDKFPLYSTDSLN